MDARARQQAHIELSPEALEGLSLVGELYSQYRGGNASVGAALQDLCTALLPEVLPRPIGFTWETWDASQGFVSATVVSKRWVRRREEANNVDVLEPYYGVKKGTGYEESFTATDLEDRLRQDEDPEERSKRAARLEKQQEYLAEQAEREERAERQAAAKEQHREPLTAFVSEQRAKLGALRAGKMQATLEVGLGRVPRSLYPDGAPSAIQRWELVLRAVEHGYIPATIHGESVLEDPKTTNYLEQKVVTAAGLLFAEFLINNGFGIQ